MSKRLFRPEPRGSATGVLMLGLLFLMLFALIAGVFIRHGGFAYSEKVTAEIIASRTHERLEVSRSENVSENTIIVTNLSGDATTVIAIAYISSSTEGTGQSLFENWQYWREIQIDHTKVDNALDNFPATVFLDENNFDFTNVSFENGQDIRFVVNGSELAYEIEYFSKAAEKGVIHTKIPTVSATENTSFYIFYSNPAAGYGQNPTAVWDSNFAARYSMKDLTTSTIEDSTANANDGTKKGANEPIEVDGKIAKAQDFDGSNDYIAFANNANTLDHISSDSFTIEMWVYVDAFGNTWLLSSRAASTGINRYNLTLTTDGKFCFYQGKHGYTNSDMLYSGVKSTGTWYYICATINGTTLNLWINGTKEATGGNVQAASNNTNGFSLGAYLILSNFANAKEDEVRISKGVVRSDAWIKASYHSGNNTLLSVGEESSETTSFPSVTGIEFKPVAVPLGTLQRFAIAVDGGDLAMAERVGVLTSRGNIFWEDIE